jgi:hypothetical protein
VMSPTKRRMWASSSKVIFGKNRRFGSSDGVELVSGGPGNPLERRSNSGSATRHGDLNQVLAAARAFGEHRPPADLANRRLKG